MAKAAKSTSLHDLLEGLTKAHRQDIIDYSGGHLNESNLAKPQAHSYASSSSRWNSTNKPLQKSSIPQPIPRETARESKMRETVANFSMGTSGNLPVGKGYAPMRRMGTKGPVKVGRHDSAGQYSKTDDGVLVEEMRPGELLLANSRYSKPKAWAEEDLVDEDTYDLKAVSQSYIKDQNLAKLKHTFVPSHLHGITKKDQFNSFMKFENNIIRKSDTLEQNVLSGVKAVEHLENKLQQDLDNLQYNGYGPNFHRLQVYSDTFDDLIQESNTFGFILKTVKKEYDDYVASLLDTQGSKHKVLYEQVENMSQRQGANPRILAQEKVNVETMEDEAKEMLDKNDRLRRELEEELELASQPQPEAAPAKKLFLNTSEPALELTDQIEEMRANILEKLDQINELHGTLRKDFVPSTVVTHLEQCIKETEVEIQKLQSQKEYFERSTGDMEKELQDLIEEADTTEKDARRVWKRINAVKRLHSRHGIGASLPDDDDSSEDDEGKWSWYIS